MPLDVGFNELYNFFSFIKNTLVECYLIIRVLFIRVRAQYAFLEF